MSGRFFPFPAQERFARSAEHELRFDVSAQKSKALKHAEKTSIGEKIEDQLS